MAVEWLVPLPRIPRRCTNRSFRGVQHHDLMPAVQGQPAQHVCTDRPEVNCKGSLALLESPTFAGSDAGGQRAAAIYTLIQIAKLNGAPATVVRLHEEPPSLVGQRQELSSKAVAILAQPAGSEAAMVRQGSFGGRTIRRGRHLGLPFAAPLRRCATGGFRPSEPTGFA